MPAYDLFVSVTALTDRNATVATVELFNPDGTNRLAAATGSSKREQGDVTDDFIAVNLAVGRALEKLGRQLRSKANARVRLATENPAEARKARKNGLA